MNRRTYWNMCRLHNWHFEDEEDMDIWREEMDNHLILTDACEKDPALLEIFRAWENHMHYSGPRPIEPKIEE